MERLEVSIIDFSYVKKNDVFRFDSNYFLKEMIIQEGMVRKHTYKTLLDSRVELKSFGAYSLNNFVEYQESGVPFIRGINMKKGRVLFDNVTYISEKANNLLWKSEVKPEMILLSMSGTIGEVAIASSKWDYPINSNQDIAKIETNGNINPYLLYAFLLSKFGQNYLKREARGSVQQHVFLSQIEKFEIPVFEQIFISKLQKIIVESEDFSFKSDSLYKQAEEILLNEIGLLDFKPSKNPVNVKSFKNSFIATGRLDAEFYQKKYEDYSNLIKSYINGYERLDLVCNLKINNFNPDDNTEYNYIELSNIGKTGDITGCTVELGKDLPTRARRMVSSNDVIVSSIEGSLQSCAIITSNYHKALCSTGFYVIQSDKINSETLLVLFKSEVMQNILKQSCSGTILTGINKDEFSRIPIPLIDIEIQTKIAKILHESFKLKKISEHLLDVAKRSVEIAIEQNEKVALDYIEHNSIK